MCRSCLSSLQPPRVPWPDPDQLSQMIQILGYAETGRQLGVSDNAVRKHMKHLKPQPSKP
jgi:hypothetical protein